MTASDSETQNSAATEHFNSLVQASLKARTQGLPDRAKQFAIDAIELAPVVSTSGNLADVIEVFDSGFLSPLSVSAVRRALSAAPETNVQLLAESKLAQVHYFTHGEYDHAVRWAESAADGLLETREARAASRALNRLALIHYHEGILNEAKTVAMKALEESVAAGVLVDASLAHNTLSKIDLLSGAPESAITHAERGLLYAEETESDLWVVANLFAMAMAQVTLGRLAEARDVLERASGKPTNRSELPLGSALVSAYMGNQSQALEHLGVAESKFGTSSDRETKETYTRLKLIYAGELARLGIHVMPVIAACEALKRFVAGPVTPHIRLALACAYGQAAAVSGENTEVENANEILSSFDRAVSGGELRPPLLVGLVRADLELAARMSARGPRVSATRSPVDSSYPLESRLLQTQLARLMIRDETDPDRNKIRVNLDEVENWFEDHSAHGFSSLVGAARKELQARRGGRPLYPVGLTDREVEVLRLLSTGMTNHQIAAQLTLSVHTVGQHVRNIYGKTGSSNRSQATAFARSEGLSKSSQ